MLSRWIHPEKGLISPKDFIPIFEENGFISIFDKHMCRKTCEYLSYRKKNDLHEIPLSVNISRISLYNIHLAEDLFDIISEYRISPNLLRIEITEAVYGLTKELLIAQVDSLQNLGFFVYMDDFGSGYSSLDNLKDLPIDVLKIDMAFLENFETSNRAKKILAAVIQMGKSLNLPIIAEGVETAFQLEFLKKIGCNHVQGYLFSKPLSCEDFEKYIVL